MPACRDSLAHRRLRNGLVRSSNDSEPVFSENQPQTDMKLTEGQPVCWRNAIYIHNGKWTCLSTARYITSDGPFATIELKDGTRLDVLISDLSEITT